MIDIPDARLRLSESDVGITTDVILSAALDELESARQRIAELESRLETNDKLSSVDIYD